MEYPLLPFIDKFKRTPGAISVTEMIGILNAVINNLQANDLLNDTKIQPIHSVAIDLGSHAGKSTLPLALALTMMGRQDLLVMVDPCYDLENKEIWKHTVQGSPEKMPWSHVRAEDFCKRVFDRIYYYYPRMLMIGDISTGYLKRFSELDKPGISYVFIDTDDHQPELVHKEVSLIENKILPGGLILFHDYGNQYTAPKEQAERLVGTGKYELIDMRWDLICEYVSKRGYEEGNDSWHMSEHPTPCFVGGIKRKR